MTRNPTLSTWTNPRISFPTRHLWPWKGTLAKDEETSDRTRSRPLSKSNIWDSSISQMHTNCSLLDTHPTKPLLGSRRKGTLPILQGVRVFLIFMPRVRHSKRSIKPMPNRGNLGLWRDPNLATSIPKTTPKKASISWPMSVLKVTFLSQKRTLKSNSSRKKSRLL